MKKVLCLCLALAMLLSLAACSSAAVTTTTTAQTTVAQTTAAQTTAAAEAEGGVKYYGALSYGNIDESELSAFHLALSRLAGNSGWPDGGSADAWKAMIFDDLNSALLALSRGDIVQMELMSPVVDYIAAQNGDYAKLDLFSTGSSALAMAVLKEKTELLQKLNLAIRSMKDDGTLAKLEKQYLADPAKEPEAVEIPVIPGADTVRVLVTGDLPPFDYVTADGKAAGYNVALLSALSKQMGVNIELVYGNAGSRFIQLTSGKADVVFWAKGVTFLENGNYDFSADLPQGVAITNIYTTQDNSSLVKKS